MKTRLFAVAALATLCLGAFAQESKPSYKFYGFIRNFAYYDSMDGKSGTAELFYYIPNDTDVKANNFNFTAITSRVGVDVSGYEYNGVKAGAKIEADFYNGLTGVTGTALLRLRQAFMTLSWGEGLYSAKIGQAWHPMAADIPEVISLNAGAPFGPFSRTPQMLFEQKVSDNWSVSEGLVWQMQYTSAGPGGASANFQKYSGIPELYFAVNYKDAASLARLGVDYLSLMPYNHGKRMNAASAYAYYQYKKDAFLLKAKTTLAEDGSHMNLTGGYAVSGYDDIADKTSYTFTPTRSSSTWVNVTYGKEWKIGLFGGYVMNLGTAKKVDAAVMTQTDAKDVLDGGGLFFCKNSAANVNSLWRFIPTVYRNLGKVTFALEYEMTSVNYGDKAAGLNYDTCRYDLGKDHTVTNNRLIFMAKYAF